MSFSKSSIQSFLKNHSSFSKIGYAFEALTKNLELIKPSGQECNSYLITSSVPSEGKTTVAVNLALAQAFAGKKVLLMDCDLPKPSLHQLLELSNDFGMSNLLEGATRFDSLVQTTSYEISGQEIRLSLVASGRITYDLLRKKLPQNTVKQALEHYKTIFDVILLDSSPVLAANEAVFLGPLVDGVILVLNTGTTLQQQVTLAKERLEEVDSNILGVIMNQFKEKLHGQSLHHYYDYYRSTA